jgi:hypothetical protein
MNFLLNHSNPDYNYVIKELQNYMFTQKNMNGLLNPIEEKPILIPFPVKELVSLVPKENKISIPSPSRSIEKKRPPFESGISIKEKDSLFWSFFIMVNGDLAYELLKPIHLVKEKKIKIEYIEKLRQNKVLLKQYKFATMTHIENQLLNEIKIDLNTFFSLSLLENINIFYIYKKTFYELILDNSKPIFIVYRNNNYSFAYSFEKITIDFEIIEKYRKDFYKIDVLNKPIKSISSYKLQELIDFCNKMNLDIIHKETNKPKKKQELYEALVQNLSSFSLG